MLVITQWSVFAIRNLCEDNEENKKLIGSTKLESLNSNAVLKDLDLEASYDGKKLSVSKSSEKQEEKTPKR